MFRAVIYFCLMAFALSSKGVQWKYEESVYGPKHWNKVSAHCSETAQSPINIDTSAVKEKPNLQGLSFTADNKGGKVRGTLTNNGHAPTLKIDKPKGTASLTGGPLGDSVYKLEQLHFHFGCDDDEGSEHTVDGHPYSGELHLVTFNTKYPDFSTAADKPDGLAVIGVFSQKKAKRISRFATRLASQIIEIQKADSSVAVRDLALFKLVPELADLSKASFYSYKGSLTTPPCYQSVSWIVLKNPGDVGTDMLKALRTLKNYEKHSLCGNFRPTQPLNGRTVSVHPE